MNSILMVSSSKSAKDLKKATEIDPALLEQISGGCGCGDSKVTKTQTADGESYSVDPK